MAPIDSNFYFTSPHGGERNVEPEIIYALLINNSGRISNPSKEMR